MRRTLLLFFSLLAAGQVDSAPVRDPLEILQRFQPRITFASDEADNPRAEYPVSYTKDNDEIEDNFSQLDTSTEDVETCYGHLYDSFTDAEETPGWIAEYHYYYAANYYDSSGLGGLRVACYTHEHDWEWIYIIGGWDDEGEYRPYVACFSSHDADNVAAIQNRHYAFFPYTAGGSLWSGWQDGSRPRIVTCCGDDNRPLATVLRSGNEFDGSPTQPFGSQVHDSYPIEVSADTDYGTSPCGGSGGSFYFGDPETYWNCILSRDECDDPRAPPWDRGGMWENNPLPSDFCLPLPSEWPDKAASEDLFVMEPPAVTATGESLLVRFALADPPGVGWQIEIRAEGCSDRAEGIQLWRGEWSLGSGRYALTLERPAPPDGPCGSLVVAARSPWGSTVPIGRLAVPEMPPLRFSITPNPSRGAMTLRLPEGRRPTQVDLYDLTGRRLRAFAVPQDVSGTGGDEIVLEGIATGVYWLRGTWTGGRKEVCRVIVVR